MSPLWFFNARINLVRSSYVICSALICVTVCWIFMFSSNISKRVGFLSDWTGMARIGFAVTVTFWALETLVGSAYSCDELLMCGAWPSAGKEAWEWARCETFIVSERSARSDSWWPRGWQRGWDWKTAAASERCGCTNAELGLECRLRCPFPHSSAPPKYFAWIESGEYIAL